MGWLGLARAPTPGVSVTNGQFRLLWGHMGPTMVDPQAQRSKKANNAMSTETSQFADLPQPYATASV